MNLIARKSGGANIVGRPQARLAWYPSATAPAAQVAVYWLELNKPVSAARLIGTFAPGQEGSALYNPATDQDVWLFTISYSASGTPSHSSLADAFRETKVLLSHQRETDAPTIGQMGDATTESVTVGVSNYSGFARKRRVKIATALTGGGALSSPTITIFDSTPDAPPPFIDFARGTGPQTIYVAVAHSSGDGTRWTPESNILTLTFASAEGTGGGGGSGSGEPTGGTTGDFNPERRDQLTL